MSNRSVDGRQTDIGSDSNLVLYLLQCRSLSVFLSALTLYAADVNCGNVPSQGRLVLTARIGISVAATHHPRCALTSGTGIAISVIYPQILQRRSERRCSDFDAEKLQDS